jgi:hypothetical protein
MNSEISLASIRSVTLAGVYFTPVDGDLLALRPALYPC